jgi:hypothetical protein
MGARVEQATRLRQLLVDVIDGEVAKLLRSQRSACCKGKRR